MSEEWQCSICLRFLHKPVANYCGHMFCFWCHHQAMSPFSESTCPLCRSTYQQFPAVAWKVDNFLRAYFPDEYTARKAEIEEEEEQKDFRSPSRKILVPARSQPGHPEQADFECDCCHQLLYQPAILNCGHIVCSKACLDVGEHSNSIANEDDEEPSHVPRICPWDSRRTPRPKVCKLIADFLDRNFPGEYNRRRTESASNVLEGNVVPCSKQKEDEKKNLTTTKTEEASPSEDVQEHGDDVCPVETREDQSTGAGVNRSIPISEGNAILMAWVRGEADHYPHYGIGCDVCGQYPIVGRRYKCLDCPEASGFDVCGDCYDLGPELMSSSFSGRFGQSHKLSHRLELIRPRITSLHLLKAANPDLSMDELLRYLNMSLEPASETQRPSVQQGMPRQEFAGEEVHGEQDRQRHQEHVNNQDDRATAEEAAATGTERQQHGDVEDLLELLTTDRELDEEDIQPEDIAFGLRRGPRPVEDESAEWPSPSAPHNPRRPRSL